MPAATVRRMVSWAAAGRATVSAATAGPPANELEHACLPW